MIKFTVMVVLVVMFVSGCHKPEANLVNRDVDQAFVDGLVTSYYEGIEEGLVDAEATPASLQLQRTLWYSPKIRGYIVDQMYQLTAIHTPEEIAILQKEEEQLSDHDHVVVGNFRRYAGVVQDRIEQKFRNELESILQ